MAENMRVVLFFMMQVAVHDSVFVKIAVKAWTILKTAFQGSSEVVVVKLQGLRREFETLSMNQEESVQAFLMMKACQGRGKGRTGTADNQQQSKKKSNTIRESYLVSPCCFHHGVFWCMFLVRFENFNPFFFL